MFDLDKILDIIKENDKEVFLIKENKEPIVLISLNRYKELKGKYNENIPLNKFNKDSEEDYSIQVKKTIMPGQGDDII